MRLTEVMKYSTHSLSDDLSEKSELIPRFHPDFQLNYPEMLSISVNLLEKCGMRLEATARQDEYKVWMTDGELNPLRRAAASHRDDLVIQLGGYVGLRAFAVPQIRSKDVKRSEDGEHFRLRVPEGKNTTGNGGKPETWDRDRSGMIGLVLGVP